MYANILEGKEHAILISRYLFVPRSNKEFASIVFSSGISRDVILRKRRNLLGIVQ
jgi:hypothetical protein